jgi:tetratricopeptide (TPR) repeat protein
LPPLVLLALAGCGSEPPPAPRTARAAHASAADEDSGGGGPASASSMGDSALEPAAKDALTSEDWPRAESLYREMARRQPRNPAGKRGLGEALIRQEKFDKAAEALQGSLDIADDVRTRLDLAVAFGGLGRYPSALPHLRKAVKMAPDNPAAWAALADALVKVEKPDGAADVLAESQGACRPCEKDDAWGHAADETAEALDTRAEKQLATNDSAGAHKFADAAAKLRPELPATHLAQAKLARADGDKKVAIAEFRKAVEGFSDAKSEPGTSARLELAGLLLGEGNGAEAVKLAREVVDARGDSPAALDTLGRACDATKDVACARDAYEKLTKLPPSADLSKETVDHARQRMKDLKGKKTKAKGKAKGKRRK